MRKPEWRSVVVRVLDAVCRAATAVLAWLAVWRDGLVPPPPVDPGLTDRILARVICDRPSLRRPKEDSDGAAFAAFLRLSSSDSGLTGRSSVYQPTTMDAEVVQLLEARWLAIHAVHIVRETPTGKPAYVVFDLTHRGRATA